MSRIQTLTIRELMEQCGVYFGTSGARGEVTAMTDRVGHGYATGFLQYLAEAVEFVRGGRVALAGDLRPSTPYILAACAEAIRDAGASRCSAATSPPPRWPAGLLPKGHSRG